MTGMEAARVELDRDLVDLLEELHRPAKQAARELIVLELYRQCEESSGRAAQLRATRGAIDGVCHLVVALTRSRMAGRNL